MGLSFDYFGDYQLTLAGLALAITLGAAVMFWLPRFE
jgi:hypothetical protein